MCKIYIYLLHVLWWSCLLAQQVLTPTTVLRSGSLTLQAHAAAVHQHHAQSMFDVELSQADSCDWLPEDGDDSNSDSPNVSSNFRNQVGYIFSGCAVVNHRVSEVHLSPVFRLNCLAYSEQLVTSTSPVFPLQCAMSTAPMMSHCLQSFPPMYRMPTHRRRQQRSVSLATHCRWCPS